MSATILVIEEDFDLARLFEAILQIDGYQVVIEPNLSEAAAMLADYQIDAVVYDWSTKNMAGYLWLDSVRAADGYGGVPILLVCDSVPARGIRDLLGALGIPMIEKPFDLRTFSRALEGLLPVRERQVGV
jgi:DNA-binding response OmpR family regulator